MICSEVNSALSTELQSKFDFEETTLGSCYFVAFLGNRKWSVLECHIVSSFTQRLE